MAILNFANTYDEIKSKLGLTSSDSDYVKLYFTKDGHILTHGTDFTALFSASGRGLVSQSTGKTTDFLRGNNTWAAITTSDLPIADSYSVSATDKILNSAQVHSLVNASFSANDAMRYKGTIEYTSGAFQTNTSVGSVSGFPTNCEVGDTYRFVSSTTQTVAGQKCSNGDLLICIKDGSGSDLNSSTYWTVVESNINGYVTHYVNNVAINTYSTDLSTTFNIYAPTSGGTQGQILVSNGKSSAPTWVTPSSVSVGTASSVANALTIGTGLVGTATTYNGSTAVTVSLGKATNSTLGGVIIDKSSTNKTISVDSDGNIYLTAQNIINALKYDPAAENTWRPISINGTDIGSAKLNFVPSGSIGVKHTLSTDTEDLSFELCWYNVSTSAYEYE